MARHPAAAGAPIEQVGAVGQLHAHPRQAVGEALEVHQARAEEHVSPAGRDTVAERRRRHRLSRGWFRGCRQAAEKALGQVAARSGGVRAGGEQQQAPALRAGLPQQLQLALGGKHLTGLGNDQQAGLAGGRERDVGPLATFDDRGQLACLPPCAEVRGAEQVAAVGLVYRGDPGGGGYLRHSGSAGSRRDAQAKCALRRGIPWTR